MGLNEEQKKVVLHGDTPMMVVAAAGSGKSTTLITRVARLLQQGEDNIIVITFTRNTANDLNMKLNALKLKDSNGNVVKAKGKVICNTFHGVCSMIASQAGIKLSSSIKEYEVENIFKKLINDDNTKIDMKDIMSFISYQKNNMIGVDDEFLEKESEYFYDDLRMFYKAYEDYKKKNGLYDFDDYLLVGLDILEKDNMPYKCDYLLIDEAQDSNEIQWRIADLLCPSGAITVFGDGNQSLYGFRGARPELFMDFYKTHENTTVINMNTNYRSNVEIVDRSNYFIKQYFGDYEYYKDAIANSQSQADIELEINEDEEGESQYVADKIQTLLGLGYKGSDMAVLYRNNVQSQTLENELKVRGIDYFIENNGSFFERKEIDIIMNILRLIDNYGDDSAFEKLFKYRCKPFSYLSNQILSDIKRMATTLNTTYFEACIRITAQDWQRSKLVWFVNEINKLKNNVATMSPLLNIITYIIEDFELVDYIDGQYRNAEEKKERLESLENLKKFIRSNTLKSFLSFVYDKNDSRSVPKDNQVQLMTIHKSKGLEFKAVFIIGLCQGKFPSSRSLENPSLMDEESRVFYVACTRAKEKMYLSQIDQYNKFAEEYFGKEEYKMLKGE